MQLMEASKQWATRPKDERFVSLLALQDTAQKLRDNSRGVVVSSRRFRAAPAPQDPIGSLIIDGSDGWTAAPTHHAFGQLASLVKAPAGYLRGLPAAVAADCINYGLRTRDIEDVGLLMTLDGDHVENRAATGPNYGRIWNAEIADTLVARFGNGLSGDWRVPGEFGKQITVTKENTTLYLGDTNMFVFLADEVNRIEVPNRRDGKSGTMARGFFVANSEVGDGTLYLGFFLFDYACGNRIVWGAQDLQEIRIRHTKGAPDRWLEELQPALAVYSNSAASPIEAMLQAAQQRKLDNVTDFLAERFGARIGEQMNAVHLIEEGRPIESIWDAITGATAFAKSIETQAERVKVEREAGKLFRLAA